MKKIVFAIVACVALLGFTACNNDPVESQIFDLSFDGSKVEEGEIMAYQLTIEPIFIEAINKVAPQASPTSKTFMVNSTEKKAKADVEAAFRSAAAQAQKVSDDATIRATGIKTILKHSNSKNPSSPKVFIEYTFK